MTSAYRDQNDWLVDACRQGDRRAQRELFRLYAKAMLNTSFRILNSKEEAEDVLQEAFLDAFNGLKSFKGESSFGAWLKRIVVNRSLTALRQRKALGLAELTDDYADDIEDTGVEGIQTGDEEAVSSLKLVEVRKSIQELPDGFRIVLSLYLLEGYDHEEIAGILKISESTSRSQFLRAKRKLMFLLITKGIKA